MKPLLTFITLFMMIGGVASAKSIQLNCVFLNGTTKNLSSLRNEKNITDNFSSYMKDIFLNIDYDNKKVITNTEADIYGYFFSIHVLENEIGFSYTYEGEKIATLTYTLNRFSGSLNEVRIMKDIDTVMYRNWKCLPGKKLF
jgi:hypothetical protein